MHSSTRRHHAARTLTATATLAACTLLTAAGPAHAAPQGSGCNKTDIAGISACYVNYTGGGYAVTVYNHRANPVSFLPGNLTVFGHKNKTYSTGKGHIAGVTLFQPGSGAYIGTIPISHFTSATP